MTSIIRWEVSPAPTGPYKSFSKRAWPIGFLKENERHRVLLLCDDEYIPALVKSGDHGEIKISLDVYNKTYGTYKLVTLKRRAKTLSEAKKISEDFFLSNPKFINNNPA